MPFKLTVFKAFSLVDFFQKFWHKSDKIHCSEMDFVKILCQNFYKSTSEKAVKKAI